MPINKGEKESDEDFMGRCMHHFKHDSKRDYGHEQSIAACLNISRQGDKKKKKNGEKAEKAIPVVLTTSRGEHPILIVPLTKAEGLFGGPPDEHNRGLRGRWLSPSAESARTTAEGKIKEYRQYRRLGKEHPDLGRIPRMSDIAGQEMTRDQNTPYRPED